jgi:serine/threonine-protein kinase
VTPRSPVTVNVSSGPAPVPVPELVGLTEREARAALKALGLSVGTVTERAAQGQVPETVLSQSPVAGHSVAVNGKVDLVIVEKQAEATVPALVGDTEAQALAVLEKAGLAVRTESAPTSEPARVGLVLKQSVRSGRRVAKGTAITVVIGAAETVTTTTTTTITTAAVPG